LTIGGKGVVAGISLNNNPTVTDLWNSTPVWSFPYTGSELAPTPGAAPLLFDGISERVLGPSAYVMINDKLYLEAGAYKSMSDRWLSNVGLTADDNLHMNGVAPYWRAVLQFERGPSYYSVGIVGLDAKLQPDPTVSATDHYRDIGMDATYQYTDGGKYAIQANLSYVHEKRSLDASFAAEASDAVDNHLDSLHFDAGFAWNQTWVASVGWFNTSGSSNSGLFAPAEVEGSATGSPDSRGYTIQLEYVGFGKIHSFLRPWLNLRLGLQYIGYNRFNGGDTDYDGFGRSASDNNTLFGFAWVAF
ncbi:MAG: cytochrome C, partial [Steroidobacterales bacterium]